ncbi:MAG: CRISPR-associated endoribonuclease Cas6 [Endomicrobia bacterium]|nr:CRISPR-associated endoribonuclease Cas6 [Endomicrobiia bacterium]
MKFTILSEFIKTPVSIRKNYRRDVLRFIKKALSKSDSTIYQLYYADVKKNTTKPLTFSVAFNIQENKPDCFYITDPNFKLYFSSIDPLLSIAFYNGLLVLKKEGDIKILSDSPQRIIDIFPQKQILFDKNEILFKTLSPILVRKFVESKKGNGFLSYCDENFVKNLKLSILSQSKYYLKKEYMANDIIISIKEMKSVPILNYGGEIGNSGYLQIAAPKEVLYMIYYSGIGAKRSQGFGMLEVVG